MDYKSFSNTRITALLILLAAFLVNTVTASLYTADGTELRAEDFSSILLQSPSLAHGYTETGKVVFFTNSHCGACRSTQDFIDAFIVTHPEIILEMYDLSSGADSLVVYEQYKRLYHREYLSTPSVMIGNLTVEGSQDIRDHLEEIRSVQEELES